MGLDPLPPSTCVHLGLTPSPPPCGRHKWMGPNERLLTYSLLFLVCNYQTLLITEHRSMVTVNRNRNLQTSKVPLKNQGEGTILFTSTGLFLCCYTVTASGDAVLWKHGRIYGVVLQVQTPEINALLL